MAPIRVGFIGLSKTGWASDAHLPYLLANPDKYHIVAISNSSVESSKAAIELYKLPGNVRAYGNPEDLANDKDIDLVVCAVRGYNHVKTISPSLKKGKNVYVEWPLAKNLAEAKELLALKNKFAVKRAIVGLQGRQSPIVEKLKEIIAQGKIGKVLSSTWAGAAGMGGDTNCVWAKDLTQIELGTNIFIIHFGHSIDYVQKTLGYGFEPAPKTLLARRRKTTKYYEDFQLTKLIDPAYPITTVDTIFLNGTLSTGIPLSVTLRAGAAFKGTPGLDWRIYGEKGEIRITAAGVHLQIGYDDTRIELHDFEKNEVVEIKWDDDKRGVAGLATSAKNVGRVYEAYFRGEDNCTFEDGVERHELIDEMYKENGIVF